jgi:hypothetical protein
MEQEMNLDYSNIGDYSRDWGFVMDNELENVFDTITIIICAYFGR